MARAKVIELSEQELIDIVDRYEYLSTLLNSKITPNINRLEKLESQEIFLHNKKISMNLKLSKIKDKQAAIEDIDYLTFAPKTK